MNAQFHSLFENVCRCFGHTPTSRGGGGMAGEPLETSNYNRNEEEDDHELFHSEGSVSSHEEKRRTKKNNKKKKQQQQQPGDDCEARNNQDIDSTERIGNEAKSSSSSQNRKEKQTNNNAAAGSSHSRQPPRPEGNGSTKTNNNTSNIDNETAQALAQAKLAANPPRYRNKRQRPSQTKEEIFRNKNGSNPNNAQKSHGNKNKHSSSNIQGLKTDFSRLLNPSLALCFATPVRGTEEEQELLSLDNDNCSDTATLNTNGENGYDTDTITSTMYFDSKYAHIQESTPPMQLFSEFKLSGQASKDEIRTIMATDSHSSVRMMSILQQQEQLLQQEQVQYQQQEQLQQREQNGHAEHVLEEAGGGSSSKQQTQQSSGSVKRDKGRNSKTNQGPMSVSLSTASGGVRRTKETIKISSSNEEMQDVIPDVKPLSSSTDSSLLPSAGATTRHH